MPRGIRLTAMAAAVVLAALVPVVARAGQQIPSAGRPWGDRSMSPDQRADMVLALMTQDEKLQMMAGACDPQGQARISSRRTRWATRPGR